MRTNHNNSVRDYLIHYLSLENPGFAVLLKGQWGIGKTYFIKNMLDSLEDSTKYLYISLYGILSYEEIALEMFRQLHPVLSSKGMVTAGKFGQVIMQAVLKVDVVEKKLWKSKSNSIPKYMMDSGRLLVFDDLERCSIPLMDILGYINQYVECQGCNVLIIANEEEIVDREKARNTNGCASEYRRIKEKIIGKTFLIHPNTSEALEAFIESIKSKQVRDMYERSIDSIRMVFNDSDHNNLRLLKHALLDFERLYLCLNAELQNNEKLSTHLLEVLMVLSFEYNSGIIQEKNILEFRSSYMLNRIGHSDDFDETEYGKIVIKYSSDSLHDILMDGDLWAEIIVHNIIDPDRIIGTLEKSKYYSHDLQPSWVKLWSYNDLIEEEFSKYLNIVIKEFTDMVHDEIGVVKHISSLLLRLADIGLNQQPKEEILSISKANVDHLAEIGRLMSENKNRIFDDDESWGGLGFLGRNLEEFKELCKYIHEVESDEQKRKLPGDGKDLLALMTVNPQQFYDHITFGNIGDALYYEIPILAYISVKDFVNSFIQLNPEIQRRVIYSLKKRYKYPNINKELRSEQKWISSVCNELIKYRDSLDDGLTRHRLEVFTIPQMQEAEELLTSSSSAL
ncbi:MAG: hypothetical protein KAR44_10390 [Candidatus Aegiribacteria sp.]|nr:hypothetical protein [Candidatus Aegiribacteria sp.]